MEGSADLNLAEGLLRLVLDDRKGVDRANCGMGAEAGLANALPLELAEHGCLVEEDGRRVATDATPPRHPLLSEALEAVRGAARPRTAKAWVTRLPRESKPIRSRVAPGLVARGVLGEEHARVLGLFPRERFPERDPGPELELRPRLRQVLGGDRVPTSRERMLIAFMQPYGLAGGVAHAGTGAPPSAGRARPRGRRRARPWPRGCGAPCRPL